MPEQSFCLVGLSLYFALPRHAFAEVQRVLFPRYFTINACLSLTTLIIFVKRHPADTWDSEIAIQVSLWNTWDLPFIVQYKNWLYFICFFFKDTWNADGLLSGVTDTPVLDASPAEAHCTEELAGEGSWSWQWSWTSQSWPVEALSTLR